MTTAELEAAANAYADNHPAFSAYERGLRKAGFIDGFLAGQKQTLQEVQDEFNQGSEPCTKS